MVTNTIKVKSGIFTAEIGEKEAQEVIASLLAVINGWPADRRRDRALFSGSLLLAAGTSAKVKKVTTRKRARK